MVLIDAQVPKNVLVRELAMLMDGAMASLNVRNHIHAMLRRLFWPTADVITIRTVEVIDNATVGNARVIVDAQTHDPVKLMRPSTKRVSTSVSTTSIAKVPELVLQPVGAKERVDVIILMISARLTNPRTSSVPVDAQELCIALEREHATQVDSV